MSTYLMLKERSLLRSISSYRLIESIGFRFLTKTTFLLMMILGKCIFLGVSEKSKAYRFYEPNTKRIIISKNVVFYELKACDWENTDEGSKGVVIECHDE